MKKFGLFCVALGLLALPSVASAAIAIGSAAPVTEPFGAAAPPVTNWSTNVATGFGTGSGEATDLATLTTFINTQTASGINLAFPTTATNPPTNQNASARYNTNGQFIQTWPTTSTANVVLATLQNTSGTNLTGLNVQYTSAEIAGTPAVEELPGHNIFWSPTGAAGSWTHVFTQPGAGSANFNLGAINIANNQTFYVLWADDNAAAGNPGEVAYTIDSAQFTATLGGAPVPQFGTVSPNQAQGFEGGGLTFNNGAQGTVTPLAGSNALQVNGTALNATTDQVDLRTVPASSQKIVGVDLKAWETSATSDFEAADHVIVTAEYSNDGLTFTNLDLVNLVGAPALTPFDPLVPNPADQIRAGFTNTPEAAFRHFEVQLPSNAQTVRVRVNLSTDSTTEFMAVDNISVITRAVPEPASVAMIGLGMIGMIGYGVRRRRSA